MIKKTTPKPAIGSLVKVAGYPRRTWRVLAKNATAQTAHLTALNSFERLDYRDVPLERLVVVEGIYG